MLVEVVVVVENAVAAGSSMVHVADNSKKVVVGECVTVEAGSARIAAVDSMDAAVSETAAGSKNVQTP